MNSSYKNNLISYRRKFYTSESTNDLFWDLISCLLTRCVGVSRPLHLLRRCDLVGGREAESWRCASRPSRQRSCTMGLGWAQGDFFFFFFSFGLHRRRGWRRGFPRRQRPSSSPSGLPRTIPCCAYCCRRRTPRCRPFSSLWSLCFEETQIRIQTLSCSMKGLILLAMNKIWWWWMVEHERVESHVGKGMWRKQWPERARRAAVSPGGGSAAGAATSIDDDRGERVRHE